MPEISHYPYARKRSLAVALAIAGLTVARMGPSAGAQTNTTSESVRQENLSAQDVERHHYSSPAERAQDALLIVKVKAAIADWPTTIRLPSTPITDGLHSPVSSLRRWLFNARSVWWPELAESPVSTIG